MKNWHEVKVKVLMNKEADTTVLHLLLDASLPCDLCENKESHIKFVSFTRQKNNNTKTKL